MPVLNDVFSDAFLMLDAFLKPIYYSKGGFHGITALHGRLPKGSASIARVRKWVISQTVGRYTQAVPPKPTYAHFSETTPNRIHQADLLFLPNDRGFKYTLCIVDVASRFKASRPLRNKTAASVALQLSDIYSGSTLLTWPETMMVDDGSEFKREVTTLLQAWSDNSAGSTGTPQITSLRRIISPTTGRATLQSSIRKRTSNGQGQPRVGKHTSNRGGGHERYKNKTNGARSGRSHKNDSGAFNRPKNPPPF